MSDGQPELAAWQTTGGLASRYPPSLPSQVPRTGAFQATSDPWATAHLRPTARRAGGSKPLSWELELAGRVDGGLGESGPRLSGSSQPELPRGGRPAGACQVRRTGPLEAPTDPSVTGGAPAQCPTSGGLRCRSLATGGRPVSRPQLSRTGSLASLLAGRSSRALGLLLGTEGKHPPSFSRHSTRNSPARFRQPQVPSGTCPPGTCRLHGPHIKLAKEKDTSINIYIICIQYKARAAPPAARQHFSPHNPAYLTTAPTTAARPGPRPGRPFLHLPLSSFFCSVSPRIRPSCIKRGQIPRMQRISFSRSQRSGCSTGHDTSIHTQVVCK